MTEVLIDTFKGDDAKLVGCIEALLKLDRAGALTPNGLGGPNSHAWGMLAAAACRLRDHAPGSNDPVQDTWLVGAPDLKAMSGSTESDRVIQLHFRRPATDADRKWLLDAINAKIVADTAPVGSPSTARIAWQDDPSADERWNAGLDFGQQQLCKYLGVDPDDVTWDAATEELEGDVQAVIGNILRAKFGEDWAPSDGAIYAAVSRASLSDAEHGDLMRNIDTKLGDLGSRTDAMTSEPAMWQWRNHIYRAWTKVEAPIENFRSAHAKALESGQMEVRTLYATPCTATGLWQDIRTAPTYETILVAGGDAIYPVTACWDGDPQDGWYVDGQEDTHVEIGWPTHWMPLPEGPAVARNDRGSETR